jgi:hypothetical protein
VSQNRSRAILVVNELPWAPAVGAHDDDLVLLRTLAECILEIRRSVSSHHVNEIGIALPEKLYSLQLPGGTRFGEALKRLRLSGGEGRNVAELMTLLLLRGVTFDSAGCCAAWECDNPAEVAYGEFSKAAGLAIAVARGGLAVSLATAPWKRSSLRVEVAYSTSERREVDVPNIWDKNLSDVQLAPIAAHLPLLPLYENPGHHDPAKPPFLTWKSQIPRGGERLLSAALPTIDRRTWWSYCVHGFFHRFQGSVRVGRLVVHWNGTTNRNARQATSDEEVPKDLRSQLVRFPVTQCLCRELTS